MLHPDKRSHLTHVIARRSRSNLILFVFLLLVFAVYFGQAQEQKKIKVAVLPPSASGDASSSIAQGLTSVIVTELSRSPSLEVSDRRDVEKALKEQAFGLSGCTDQSCQIELGKILQSKWVITGDLNKIGTLYILTLKILNVETSKIVYQDEEEYKGEVEGLVPKTKALTSRLADFLLTGKKPKVEIPPIKIPITTSPKVTKTALLNISSTPSGTRVIFNNKERGETPLTLSDVPAGTYKIIIKKQGYKEFWGDVTLSEGEEKEVAQTLEEKTKLPDIPSPEDFYVPPPPTEEQKFKGGEMVLIPAGEFWMGSDEEDCKPAGCGDDEKPKHKVYLDAYSIDKYEVTNAQYKECVDAGKCKKPYYTTSSFSWYNDSSKANHPVVYVDWNQASTFCKWAGKRLPTEAEWEKAARGENGNVYPWGNEFDCNKSCNSISPCKQNSTCAVGSYSSDVSSYGVYDMAGNVWEWVSDWYDENYYKNSPENNPKGPNNGKYRVFRGGPWGNDDDLTLLRGAFRGNGPTNGTVVVGFRCAADVK